MHNGYVMGKGPKVITLASVASRVLLLEIQSKGVSILVGEDGDTAALIYSGSGFAKTRPRVEGDQLFVVPYEKDGMWRLSIPELRDHEAGWVDAPSLTDLQPRPYGAISPEIQAVMDRMNRNAIIREQALLRALGQRLD